jgi:hypothetical protein
MKKGYLKTIFVYCFYAFLSMLTTYPLILRMKDHIPGFYSTDEPYAALWNFWWLKFSWLKGSPSYDYNTLAAPYGISYIKLSIFPVWEFINKWLTILTNNFVTYNLEVLFSFILSGIFMYYLTYYLTKNRLSAIFAGIVYGFSPYHFARAWQHLGLAQIQWMPLYLLSLFILISDLRVKRAFLAAICFYLVLSFDLYYSFFMFIVTIVFLAIFLLFSKKDRRYRLRAIRIFLIMAIFILIFAIPNIFALYKGTLNIKSAGVKAEYGYVRPFQDLFTQSARPLSYLLPASTHPVLGKFTEIFLGSSSWYGTSLTEHALYLGWVPLVLAFIAFKRWKKMLKRQLGQQLSDTANTKGSACCSLSFNIGFFVALAILMWLFSQPPWWDIGPIKIFMPSFFLYKVMPTIRAYCRFGIVVMLAISVLAGFGLKFILERFKAQGTKLAITTLFCGLVLFEFWNYPPFKVIDVSRVPAVYYWLKEQPGDFAIAEYPLDTNGANVLYMFYQTRHEKKMINATVPETYPNKIAKTIAKLSEPYTTSVLKWMGVKYVLVHRDAYLETELIEDREELDKIPYNPGIKFIRSSPAQDCPQKDIMCVQKTGPIDVYEVAASPIEPRKRGR